MKMDDEYFRDKVLTLLPMFHNLAINLVGEDEPDIVDILQQIARDAAEEQRHKCYSYCESNKSHTCFQCNKKLEIPNVYWCFTHHKSVRKNTKEKGCWTPRKRKEGA
jgi:hypothetical protein